MKPWDQLSTRQRQFVQRALAGLKDRDPSDSKLSQEQANEALDAALYALSKAVTFNVT